MAEATMVSGDAIHFGIGGRWFAGGRVAAHRNILGLIFAIFLRTLFIMETRLHRIADAVWRPFASAWLFRQGMCLALLLLFPQVHLGADECVEARILSMDRKNVHVNNDKGDLEMMVTLTLNNNYSKKIKFGEAELYGLLYTARFYDSEKSICQFMKPKKEVYIYEEFDSITMKAGSSVTKTVHLRLAGEIFEYVNSKLIEQKPSLEKDVIRYILLHPFRDADTKQLLLFCGPGYLCFDAKDNKYNATNRVTRMSIP